MRQKLLKFLPGIIEASTEGMHDMQLQSPPMCLWQTVFHMQPTSAGPGSKTHKTYGMPKYTPHFLTLGTHLRQILSAKTGSIGFIVSSRLH
jgi:hypothetical protein